VTGKTIDLELGQVAEIRLGAISIHDFPIAFADLPPFKVFGLGDRPALLIGTDILQSFRRVSLDFEARKVRFQMRRCGSELVTVGNSPQSAMTRMSSNGSMSVC
jgi:hypothetical protein